MAIDTQAYYYLVDPVAQFENNSGKPIVGGWCCVYESGTDNKVITLQEFDGTKNPFKVPLGSDGRCVMLVDIGKRYDLYVYDSFGNLAVSRLNILPLTNGDITVQGLTKVYHDNSTLSGDGTPQNPLKVIGGGGGELSTVITQWPVEGNGSQEDPVTVKDITLLATDDTLTSYDAEIEGKQSIVIGVNGDWFNEATDKFQTKAGMNNYVTNNTLISQINVVRNDIDTVDAKFNNYYDKSTIDSDYAKKTDIPSLEGYATENFVTNITDNKLDTSVYSSTSGDFALKSEIPSLDGYATEQWVNDQGFLKEHQSLAGYATESWVSSQGYAHSSDIPTNVSQLNNDAGYLTEHQSLDGYMEESKLEYNSDNLISGYNGSAFAGQGGGISASVDGASVNSLEIITDNPGEQYREPTNPTINGEELHIYSADHADNASNADHADNASNADHADNASNADHATNADYATNATNADYATNDYDGNNIIGTYARKDELLVIGTIEV